MNYSNWFTLLPSILLLNGCYASKGTSLFGGSTVAVGRQNSSQISTTSQQLPVQAIQKEIEVIIPVFDPNIPEHPNTREKKVYGQSYAE